MPIISVFVVGFLLGHLNLKRLIINENNNCNTAIASSNSPTDEQQYMKLFMDKTQGVPTPTDKFNKHGFNTYITSMHGLSEMKILNCLRLELAVKWEVTGIRYGYI